jgi:hypothetical protein
MYTSFGYWSKYLVIIFSLLLGEYFGHKSSIVHLYAAINNMFDLVDQFGSHHSLPFWSQGKNPYHNPFD